MSAQIALRDGVLGSVDEFLSGQRHVDFGRPIELQEILTNLLNRRLIQAGHIPSKIREELVQLTYVHLKNCFVCDELTSSPSNFLPMPECGATIAARLAVLTVTGFFQKKLISYGSENSGELFVNLVAMEGKGAVSKNSTKSMRGHTDAASFPFPGGVDPRSRRIAPSPDIICLAGFKNPSSISTTLMLLHELMSDLTAEEISQLSKPQFLIGCQRTFAAGTRKILGEEHSVDSANVLEARASGQTWVRYSHSSVAVSGSPTSDSSISSDEVALASPAAAAKRRFEEACIKRARRVVINPGDILWVNNRLAIHGRSEVDQEIGGNARWLMRAYALDPAAIRPEQYHVGSDFILFP